jgi:hypothetical protein
MFKSPNNLENFFHEKRPFFLVGIGFTRSQLTPVSMSQIAPHSNGVFRFLMPFLETTFFWVFLMLRILRKTRKKQILCIAP